MTDPAAAITNATKPPVRSTVCRERMGGLLEYAILWQREHPQVTAGHDTDELLAAPRCVGHRIGVRGATVPCRGERLTVGATLPQLLAALRIERAEPPVTGRAHEDQA